jgi:thiol:disulfide interchange protein DsbA
MTRRLALTAALALTLAACARHANPPAPAAIGSAEAPQAAPAAPAASATPPSAPPPAASATEQAVEAQESAGETAAEKPEASDSSLERMTALPADAQLPGGRWKPGVHYEPLVPAQPTGVAPGRVEVLEIMWLGCPHCYALEPSIRAWAKVKPAYVEFAQVPVMWDALHRAHAHLFYTLMALKREDLIEAAFNAIQPQRNALAGATEADSLRIGQAWAAQQGVSAADYAKAWNSAGVGAQLQRAEDLTLRYRIQEVPRIIVNGKYETDVPRAGNPANLIQLIDDLAAYEHRR